MSDRPWFKLYSADTLVDQKLDSIPPEAEGLILRMWCICNIEGRCPSDPKELARKTRRSLEYVLLYKSHCESLFDLQDGFYVSTRMEKEKKRSAINRANAGKRYPEKTYAVRTANGTANIENFALPRSDYDSDNDLEPKVLEVAKLYPAIADPFHISREHAGLIVDALIRHGDKVLDGVKRFRACYDRWPKSEYKFLPSVRKFFGESQYVFDSEKWEKGKDGGPQNAPHDYVPESVKRTREQAERKAQGW